VQHHHNLSPTITEGFEMNYKRISAMFVLGAGFVLASTTGYAADRLNLTSHLKPLPSLNHRALDLNPSSPRLVAAREEAKAEAKGLVTAQALKDASSSSFKATYTLYVGCTSTPVDVTYSTIQAAVAAALPHTLIEVCPGTYAAGGAGTGITVSTAYIKIQGVLHHSGAETLSCGSGPNPTDGSFAFELNGSYDSVQYLTIEDCDIGVASFNPVSTTPTGVRNDAVSDSWFTGDSLSIVSEYGYDFEAKDNWISVGEYGIASVAGVKDDITGNTIEGDGGTEQVGILLALTVSDKVTNNVVTGATVGLDFGALAGGGTNEGFNTFACVESNHLDGNEGGVIIIDNNTGNTFKKNYANGNSEFGFGSDATNGANAVPDAGPNVFLDNHAFGNVAYDYLDESGGYVGNNPNTNSATADYYKGNKGNIASPPAILFQ
jgi:hypothetical protein